MAQPTRKGKKTAQELIHLVPVDKGSKSQSKHEQDADSKLDTVEKANLEPRSGIKTVYTKEEHKVCRCQVEVNML